MMADHASATPGASRTALRIPLVVLMAAGAAFPFLASCDPVSGPDGPATVEIVAGRTDLALLGDTIVLSARVLDDDGDPVPASAVQWEARQPAVVNVDAAGVARAVANGTGWIVASSGPARDSVAIRVESDIACPIVGVLTVGESATDSLDPADCQDGSYYADVWRIDIPAETGVAVELIGEGFDSGLSLYALDGGTVDEDLATDQSVSAVRLPLAAGTYAAWVTHLTAATGSYEIRVAEALSPCPATRALALGDTVAGTVDATDCSDGELQVEAWRLELDNGSVLTLDIRGDGFVPGVAMGDTFGNLLDVRFAVTHRNRIVMEKEIAAGSYDVWALSDPSTDAGGDYQLAVVPGPAIGTCQTPGAIQVPDTVTGEITADDCYVHNFPMEIWTLELADTTDLVLDLTPDDGFVTNLSLTDASGTVLGWVGDPAVRVERRLDPGSYQLGAGALHSDYGAYTLSVTVAQ